MKNNFLLAGLILVLGFGTINAQNWPDRTVLPIEPYQKVGKVAPTIKGSDPIDWPKEISAPEGAPNVLLIMIDDVGFGASSTFGGPIQQQILMLLRKTDCDTTVFIPRQFVLLQERH